MSTTTSQSTAAPATSDGLKREATYLGLLFTSEGSIIG